MKLIRQTVITEITHADIVKLFSTALNGSTIFGCDYDKDFHQSLCEDQRQGESFEEKIANTIINGGKVYVYDKCAEGEVLGKNGIVLEDTDDGDVMYEITLKDVVDGLQNAADGSFQFTDPYERADARDAFEQFLDEGDYGNFDREYAETLMQIIVFNGIVYA